jgi:uncharacterized protein YraI
MCEPLNGRGPDQSLPVVADATATGLRLDRRVVLKASVAAGALALSGLSATRTPDAALAQSSVTLADTYVEGGDGVGAASFSANGPAGFVSNFPFTAVGAHWSGSVGFPVTVAMSFSPDDVTYTDPVAVTAQTDAGRPTRDDRTFADLVFTEPSSYVRYETADGEGNPTQVAGLSFTYLDSTGGPTTFDAPGDEVSAAAVNKPRVISRAEWGADESLRYDKVGEIWEKEYVEVEHVIIHHTDTPNFQDPFAAMRSIYYYHTVTQGWGDIGYNYLVDFRGNIYEGRIGGENVVGGHAFQYAYGSSGIGVIGKFAFQDVTTEAQAAIVAITAYTGRNLNPLGSADFLQVPNLPTIAAHRDVNQSTCPGDYLYDDLPLIRQYVDEVINGGATNPGTGYEVGSTVTVTVAGANLRATGRINGSVIAGMNLGTPLTITGASAAADGYSWYPVSGSYGDGFVANTVIAPSTTPTTGVAIGDTVSVSTDLLNLRSQPSTSGAVVATLPNGTQGTVIGGPTTATGYTWWQLSTARGNGWAVGDYLTKVAGTTPGTFAIGANATINATNVNLRAAAGTGGNIIAALPVDTAVTLIGGPTQSGGATWWDVRTTSNGSGWVTQDFLTLGGPGAPPEQVIYGTTNTSANVRSRPGTQWSILSTLPAGVQVQITDGPQQEAGQTWYGVYRQGYGGGWTLANQLDIPGVTTPTDPAPPPPVDQFPVGSSVTVTGGTVNFRSGPSTSASIIDVIPEGRVFTVTGAATSANGYAWYPVQSAAYGSGYIAGAFLVAGGTTTNPPPTQPPPTNGQFAVGSTVSVTGGDLNFRASPSTSGRIIGVAPNGQSFTVTGAPTTATGYTWYPVRNATFGDGYLAGEFLVAGGSTPTTPPPATGQFAVGSTVATTSGSVNYRTGPGTSAPIVNLIPAGQVFSVTGAPVVADGYTWYPLRNASYGNGYIASSYLGAR